MLVLPVAGVLGVVGLLATLNFVFSPKSSSTEHVQERQERNHNHTKELQKPINFRCKAPELDPFSKEMTKYENNVSAIRCPGQDWVKCYHSKCRVVDAIKDIITDIQCTFRDILYNDDFKYSKGPPMRLVGDDFYELRESDHVKVACVGTFIEQSWSTPKNASWSGYGFGFRAGRLPPAPPGRERTPNVLIFGFDSASRHAFIRRMPKSWKMLKEIGATVMEGYNVVGENTRHALIPILSGRTDQELPYASRLLRDSPNPLQFDPDTLMFSKMKEDGYRTAFFEDHVGIGTFQFSFNGFSRQPTDHYLRSLLMAEWVETFPDHYWSGREKTSYCFGDTPQFKVMINMTQQFLELDGKRFIFTLISDICHDNFDRISSADDDTAAFLQGLIQRAKDTLIVIMGDHGPRFSDARKHMPQGRLEHLLPLLAVRLPDAVARARPHAQRALERNARALTTPHDLHATILDVLGMRQHWNPFTVDRTSYFRALTMLEPIPPNRTCLEAGVEAHYCACMVWEHVSAEDPMFYKTARALLDHINSLIAPVKDLCVPRTLNSTAWVRREVDPGTQDGRNYQVKILADPGGSIFEATLMYSAKEDSFTIEKGGITRTTWYRPETECIRSTHPHLCPYCFCRDILETKTA